MSVKHNIGMIGLAILLTACDRPSEPQRTEPKKQPETVTSPPPVIQQRLLTSVTYQCQTQEQLNVIYEQTNPQQVTATIVYRQKTYTLLAVDASAGVYRS